MNRNLRLYRPLAAALALALASGQALALGLGQVEVKSSLYEPLVAEIPVLSSTPGEAEALKVRLASPEAFERVGLDRPASLSANLRFAVVENERGQSVIRITTPDRVNDPFISFLLEADWGKGRLLREFNVLLDPPGMAPVTRASTAAPPTEAPAQPATQPQPTRPAAPPPSAPAQQPARTAPAQVAPAPAPAPAPAAAADEYTVAAGDTLWSIAQRVRQDASVSANQMMMALLRSNPDAFIDENINRVKRGAILRIPDRAAVDAYSAAEASALVREQMDAWRARQQPQMQPAEPEAPAGAAAPARPRPADSRLELVPPRGEQPAEGARSGVDAQAAAGTELRAELARAREDIGTRDQEIQELRSRVEELEAIRDDSQRLLALKDSELATLQRRLAELEAARLADEAAAAETATQAGQAQADAQAPPVEETGEPADDASALEEDAALPPVETPPAEPAATAEPPVTEPAITPLPDTEPSAAEPLPAREGLPWYRNPWVIGGLGVMVVGLLVWLFTRRRRGSDLDDTGEGGRSYSAELAAAVPAASAASAAAAPAVDRESALLDALAERPEDLGRHLELTRYYYELGDADAFEGAAEAMYAQVYDPDNLMWKQVVAMGRELLPDHPLFATAEVPDEELPGDAGVEEAAGEPSWETGSWSESDLEAASEPPASPEPAAQPDTDWERPPADSAATQQIRFDELESASTAEDRAADTDTPAPMDVEPAPVADADEPPQAAPFEYGGDDAASTKLELARAYLDMGDVEGARGMLEEVMAEGNAGQRAEARRLLDEIR